MTKHKNHMFKCLCPPKYGGPLCEGATRIVSCNNLFHLPWAIQNQFLGDNFQKMIYFFEIYLIYISLVDNSRGHKSYFHTTFANLICQK